MRLAPFRLTALLTLTLTAAAFIVSLLFSTRAYTRAEQDYAEETARQAGNGESND